MRISNGALCVEAGNSPLLVFCALVRRTSGPGCCKAVSELGTNEVIVYVHSQQCPISAHPRRRVLREPEAARRHGLMRCRTAWIAEDEASPLRACSSTARLIEAAHIASLFFGLVGARRTCCLADTRCARVPLRVSWRHPPPGRGRTPQSTSL